MSGAVAMTLTLKAEPGSSGAHVAYITRGGATGEDSSRVWTHNVPEVARDDRDYRQTTGMLRLWAEDRVRDEFKRAGTTDGRITRVTRTGEPQTRLVRTHYRAVLAFDRDVPEAKAREMTDAWLRESFGDRHRSIAALHRNTDNIHVHAWIDARQAGETPDRDGPKLHISSQSRVREAWARIYGEAFGRELADEYVRKSRETTESRRAFKAYADERDTALARGEPFEREPPPRPTRIRMSTAARPVRGKERDAETHQRTHEGETRGPQRPPELLLEGRARADEPSRDPDRGDPPSSPRARSGERRTSDALGSVALGGEAASNRGDRADASDLATQLKDARARIEHDRRALTETAARVAGDARGRAESRMGGKDR